MPTVGQEDTTDYGQVLVSTGPCTALVARYVMIKMIVTLVFDQFRLPLDCK